MAVEGENENRQDVFIFVPVYNHAPFIERCLKSILKQTYEPHKLLVIDDGSDDGSAKIIEKVLKDCPFDSELLARENRGLCATLNQGLELSDGKYFAYLGSDDLWLARFVEERVRLLEERPEAVLGYGHTYFVDEDDRIFGSTVDPEPGRMAYRDGDVREMLANVVLPYSTTVFYRRSALDDVRWDESLRLEDYDFYLKLLPKGEFAFDSQILSAWRHHGYNTSADGLMMVREIIAAQDRHIGVLGVDKNELTDIQTRTKFRWARDLLQHGRKREAVRLAMDSWRGANSAAEFAKFIARVFVPMSIVNARCLASRRRLVEKLEI